MGRLTTALIIVLMTIFGSSAIGQEKEQKMLMLQNPCDTWSEMENIAKKHGEQLLFMGEGYTFQAGTGRPYLGGMAFFVDQEKGNWTVFQVYGDGIACMLFNGTKFKPYSGD
tara:strand:+ start:155 stop:490 length:336 start_codon:yes stop_codon:yes gene_type:complete